MLTISIGQILALSLLAITGALFGRLFRLDITLTCLFAGFLAGLSLDYITFDTGLRATNLKDIVFYIVLPVLIFDAAWRLDLTHLKRWITPVLLMATLGVLVSATVTALLVYFGIAHPTGFPWIAAMITGGILAATDPASVIAKLRAQNAPENLSTLFEGESLFNDATVVVIFGALLSYATQSLSDAPQSNPLQSYLLLFSVVFFGGIATGFATGLISAYTARFLGQPDTTNWLLVVNAFATFYLAEHLLHISGIMAVMTSAMVARHWLSDRETITQGVSDNWNWLGLSFNCILFVMMGLVVTVDMFVEQWLAMLVAIGAAIVGRLAAVPLCGVISIPLGGRIRWQWQLLMTWGGLKGAIAIALALSLPIELPYWYTIQSMVFGVVLFSLLVQGSTFSLLMKRFR